MARQEGAQCSIGLVRARIAWLAAAAGVAGRRPIARSGGSRPPRPTPAPKSCAGSSTNRAPRRTSAEESAEPTIDQAEADPGVEDKRQAVHDRGRAAAEEMRGRSSE